MFSSRFPLREPSQRIAFAAPCRQGQRPRANPLRRPALMKDGPACPPGYLNNFWIGEAMTMLGSWNSFHSMLYRNSHWQGILWRGTMKRFAATDICRWLLPFWGGGAFWGKETDAPSRMVFCWAVSHSPFTRCRRVATVPWILGSCLTFLIL